MEPLSWLLLILYLGGMALSYRIGLEKVYQRGLRQGLSEEAMRNLARNSAHKRSLVFFLLTAAGLYIIDAYTATLVFGASIVFTVMAVPVFLILSLTVGLSNASAISRRLRVSPKP